MAKFIKIKDNEIININHIVLMVESKYHSRGELYKLKQRTWTCPKCSIIHNRDINASLNLEQCQNYTVLTTV